MPQTFANRAAVMGDGLISINDGTSATYPVGSVPSIEHVHALALACNARRVFLRPGSELERDSRAPRFWKADGYEVFTTAQAACEPSYATIRLARGKQISIYADLCNRWRMGLCASDSEILRAADLYADLVGVPLQYSPASSVLSLLEKTCQTPAREKWLTPLTAAALEKLPWQQIKPYAPLFVNRYPVAAPYVHIFDKTTAYLACTTIPVGEGTPVFVSGDEYKPGGYGLWRVKVGAAGASFMGVPLLGRADAPGSELWLAQPQVDLAQKCGLGLEILDGYRWARTHKTLEDWGKRLYAVREIAKGNMQSPRADIVHISATLSQLVKAGYTQALGIMRHAPHAGEKWYHRPDICSHIVAEHYARMYAQIIKWERAAPGFLAVQTDSIIWASEQPDAWAAMPQLANKPGVMGQFHHVATLSGAAARDIITACQQGVGCHDVFDLANSATKKQVTA